MVVQPSGLEALAVFHRNMLEALCPLVTMSKGLAASRGLLSRPLAGLLKRLESAYTVVRHMTTMYLGDTMRLLRQELVSKGSLSADDIWERVDKEGDELVDDEEGLGIGFEDGEHANDKLALYADEFAPTDVNMQIHTMYEVDSPFLEEGAGCARRGEH